ncbi:emp24/gp25L/p24 family/GOLD-domain-containing protein [Radiomyces spectabilis]|uniref:emp24/gp25L/p24 family/GOLD-domain-containing protein n=1 Tax=Radiomyces spectabilis TaxID=64574 RepID=UPI00221F1455|nr:emp24/gp25L/p24 family/GOLD-domain-containing protein [Radiomyces spectabilis]KAI8388721.1 emp24/gp25L/p24 family/GOLD-domain-containing protein [Radiomyces spectabilis]
MALLNGKNLSLWLLGILLICSQVAHALYFYLDGTEKKCFLEELPKETMVIGTYKAEQFSDAHKQWIVNSDLKIYVTVEDLTQGLRVFEQSGTSEGEFKFTSAESGDHSICLAASSSSWFDSTKTRVTFDMDFDDPAVMHDHSETLSDLAQRVHELNERVQDIRREQSSQREREAEFRDQSELTNSRVVWWTIAQIVVLGAVCAWQMRHFKNFFVAKKLV